MKKLSKIAMLLLSVCLLVGALAAVVSAEDAPTFDLAAAISAAESGDTITMTGNATVTSSITIDKTLTIDLGGYTITADVPATTDDAGTVTYHSAFELTTANVTFTICGSGSIKATGLLARATLQTNAPVVNINGNNGRISIHTTGAVTPILFSVASGTHTFTNVHLKTDLMGKTGTFESKASDNKPNCKFIFNACDLTATGSTGTNTENIIYLFYYAKAEINNTRIFTDGVAIRVNQNRSNVDKTDPVIKITNSEIKVKNATSSNVSVIGGDSGSWVRGSVLIQNSTLETSAWFFRMYCNGINSDSSKYPNMGIFCENTVLRHTGEKYQYITHSAPIYLDKDCLLIGADNILSKNNASNEGGIGVNEHNKIAVVFAEEGMRTNFTGFATNTENKTGLYGIDKVLVNTDASLYKFVHDPAGNVDVPYKLVLKENAPAGEKPAGSDYFDILTGNDTEFTDGYTYAEYENTYNAETQTMTQTLVYGAIPTGSLFKNMEYGGQPSGIYGAEYQGANGYLIYKTTANYAEAFAAPPDRTAFKAPVVGLITDDLLIKSYQLMIFELDIAAPTGQFAKFNLKTLSNNGSSTSNIEISQNGTVAFKNYTKITENTVKLSTTDWSKLTFIIDTTNEKIHFYINGEYIAVSSGTPYNPNSTKISGIRMDLATTNLAADLSIAADNVVVRGYTAKPNDFSFENYMGSAYDLTAIGNKGAFNSYVDPSFSVGSASYNTLDEAKSAATALGTYPSLLKDITDVKVSEEMKIFANGHTITAAESSYDCTPVVDISGNILYYVFTKPAAPSFTVEGIKANIAVYSDFGVNIYIPQAYEGKTEIKESGTENAADYTVATINGTAYMKFTVKKAAYASAENVTLIITSTEGDTTGSSVSVTINVISYAAKVLSTSASGSEDANLMYHMLNYAQAANLYFGKAENAEITNLTSNVIHTSYDHAAEIFSTTGIGSVLKDATIDLDNSNLSYIFTIADDYSGNLTLTLNGRDYTAEEGSKEIRIDGLKVYTFAKEIKITSDTATYYYNLATFVESYNTNPDYESARSIVNAFYEYAKAAMDYKASANSSEVKSHMLNNKSVLFVGNSHTYYGKTVIEKSPEDYTREARSNDQGYFFQLCKERGANVSVTNWTFGGHGLSDLFCTAGVDHDANRGCNTVNHLAELGDLTFDYVVLQPGIGNDAEFVTNMTNIMDLFKAANPNVKFVVILTNKHYVEGNDIISMVQELEAYGVLVADWGRMVNDIINARTTVPGATEAYNKNSFIVQRSETDGYHPNMLTGYITSLWVYSVITGEPAEGQSYSFATDSTVNSAFNTSGFISSYYNYDNATTNFDSILKSSADMLGIQKLIDTYIAEKAYRAN